MTEAARPFFNRRTLVICGVLLLLFLTALRLENRPGWCKYGVGLWSAAWTHCTSQHLFDPYTLSHFLHGIIFYWLLRPLAGRVELPWRLVAALVLEIGWELLENSPLVIDRYRQQTASLDYTGDSVINSLGDMVAAVVGFCLAARVSWKIAVILFVAFELWMLYVARDNLTLNVLMLFFPLDSVKDWQLQAIGR